jgi:hypothetical protein
LCKLIKLAEQIALPQHGANLIVTAGSGIVATETEARTVGVGDLAAHPGGRKTLGWNDGRFRIIAFAHFVQTK